MSADGSRPPEEEGKGRGLPVATLTWVDADVAAGLGLTSRLCDVLCGIAYGHTNDLIAAELGLSPDTVKMHVTRLIRKLRVSDRASAVAVAYDKGALRTAAQRARLASRAAA